MRNDDEVLLRSRKIDPAAPFPPLHQALRIALYDEYAARAFYSLIVETFGARAPFVNIAKSEARHIEALTALCRRYGVARPMDPFPAGTTVATSWRANCERAVVGELANIRLYQTLLPWIAAPDARRVFINLQAASLDNHLPAFQHAAQAAMEREHYHALQGVPPSQAYARHGPVSDLIERALTLLGSRHGALGAAAPLLKNAHPAMLAGLLGGGAAVYLAREKFRRKPTE